MPLATPDLEAWFNRYEAGALHSLGGTMVQTWPGSELAAYYPEGWGLEHLEYGYVPTPGSLSTRTLLAADLGVDPDELVLTAGATEANHAVLRSLLQPGDVVILQDPLYYQFAAIAEELGAEVRRWSLPADPYRPADPAALANLVDDRTRLVVTNSPHNPTGRVLSEEDMEAIARILAARPDVYWLSDEIYRGAGGDAPTAWGLSERVIVTGAVSKRWSLPGLRLGWMVARRPLLERLRPYHEYATCCVSRVSEQILEALWPRRHEIWAANGAIAARNRALMGRWLEEHSLGRLPPVGVVTLVWPAGCRDDRNLARDLRESRGLFCLPGSTLGYPGALRIGFGHRSLDDLSASLAVLSDHLAGPPPPDPRPKGVGEVTARPIEWAARPVPPRGS